MRVPLPRARGACVVCSIIFFFFQAEDGIRDYKVTGVQTCALPIWPGRFDREIMVNLADLRGREAILKVHARNIPLDDELDLNWIARGTPGFSGADLANLLNEAAIAATRDNSDSVARKHIEIARDRILMGAAREGFIMDEDERYATAVHEAGHVAVGLAVKNREPVHKIYILPRGPALGVNQSFPERRRLMKKQEYLEDQIAVLLGGRAAEQVVLDT